MTNPTVPQEYRDDNKRMRWEFLFTEDGTLRDPERHGGLSMQEFILLYLPYSVQPPEHYRDHLGETDEDQINAFNAWMKKSIKGCWQFWPTPGNMAKSVFYFENEGDAMFFKLRWV